MCRNFPGLISNFKRWQHQHIRWHPRKKQVVENSSFLCKNTHTAHRLSPLVLHESGRVCPSSQKPSETSNPAPPLGSLSSSTKVSLWMSPLCCHFDLTNAYAVHSIRQGTKPYESVYFLPHQKTICTYLSSCPAEPPLPEQKASSPDTLP